MTRLIIKRSNLILPTLMYVAGCLIVALVGLVAGDVWVPLLFVLSGFTALLAWHLTKWPDEFARYFSFGALLLLACALNRLFYIADYVMAGARFDEWPFFVNSPQIALFKGEIITVLGTLGTVISWKLAGGMRISPSIVMQRSNSTFRVLVVAYVLSLGAMSVSLLFEKLAVALGQLLPSLLGMGLVTAFLIPVTKMRRGFLRVVAVALLSVPFFIVSLGTGMKENIILSLLPVGVIAWQYFRSPALRIAFILAGLFSLGLITSYVSYYRAEVWYQNREVRQELVVQGFMDDSEKSDAGASFADGLKAFVERNDASTRRGWAIAIADERGFYPRLVFAPMLYVFVPRFIWPEKPLIRQGWEYSGVVFGQNYIAWSGSSTAAGL